jgi:hypothetical protein
MKRTMLVTFAAFMLAFGGVSGGHAALIGLSDLPVAITPDLAGSFTFDVELVDMGKLPNVDTFNLWLMVTGASGLRMPRADVTGSALPNYIFYGNTFAFTKGNPGGDLSQLGVLDATNSGKGVKPSDGSNLLAMITFFYPALSAGTVLSFSLNADQSFAQSDAQSGALFEYLTLTGRTDLVVSPIPSAIWLLVTGVLGLIGVRRGFLNHS